MTFAELESKALKPLRVGAVNPEPDDERALKEYERGGWKILSCGGETQEAVGKAVQAAEAGEIDLLFPPRETVLQTAQRLDRALKPDHKPLIVMQALELPGYPKLLWTGFAPLVDFEAVADAIYAVKAMIRNLTVLGEPAPRVALLSCVEVVSPGVPSTVWEAVLAQMCRRGQFGKAVVDGPLAFDVAVSPEAVKGKGLKSDVEGQADLLVPPDLSTFCSLTDALRISGELRAAGVISGGPCPAVLSAPACEADLSLKIAGLLA